MSITIRITFNRYSKDESVIRFGALVDHTRVFNAWRGYMDLSVYDSILFWFDSLQHTRPYNIPLAKYCLSITDEIFTSGKFK
jgi:hypothetical protein